MNRCGAVRKQAKTLWDIIQEGSEVMKGETSSLPWGKVTCGLHSARPTPCISKKPVYMTQPMTAGKPLRDRRLQKSFMESYTAQWVHTHSAIPRVSSEVGKEISGSTYRSQHTSVGSSLFRPTAGQLRAMPLYDTVPLDGSNIAFTDESSVYGYIPARHQEQKHKMRGKSNASHGFVAGKSKNVTFASPLKETHTMLTPYASALRKSISKVEHDERGNPCYPFFGVDTKSSFYRDATSDIPFIQQRAQHLHEKVKPVKITIQPTIQLGMKENLLDRYLRTHRKEAIPTWKSIPNLLYSRRIPSSCAMQEGKREDVRPKRKEKRGELERIEVGSLLWDIPEEEGKAIAQREPIVSSAKSSPRESLLSHREKESLRSDERKEALDIPSSVEHTPSDTVSQGIQGAPQYSADEHERTSYLDRRESPFTGVSSTVEQLSLDALRFVELQDRGCIYHGESIPSLHIMLAAESINALAPSYDALLFPTSAYKDILPDTLYSQGFYRTLMKEQEELYTKVFARYEAEMKTISQGEKINIDRIRSVCAFISSFPDDVLCAHGELLCSLYTTLAEHLPKEDPWKSMCMAFVRRVRAAIDDSAMTLPRARLFFEEKKDAQDTLRIEQREEVIRHERDEKRLSPISSEREESSSMQGSSIMGKTCVKQHGLVYTTEIFQRNPQERPDVVCAHEIIALQREKNPGLNDVSIEDLVYGREKVDSRNKHFDWIIFPCYSGTHPHMSYGESDTAFYKELLTQRKNEYYWLFFRYIYEIEQSNAKNIHIENPIRLGKALQFLSHCPRDFLDGRQDIVENFIKAVTPNVGALDRYSQNAYNKLCSYLTEGKRH